MRHDRDYDADWSNTTAADRQVGDHEARVIPIAQVLGLAYHPALTGRGLAGLIAEVAKSSGGLAGDLVLGAGFGQLPVQRALQPVNTGKPRHIANKALAPAHDGIPRWRKSASPLIHCALLAPCTLCRQLAMYTKLLCRLVM